MEKSDEAIREGEYCLRIWYSGIGSQWRTERAKAEMRKLNKILEQDWKGVRCCLKLKRKQ